MTAIRIDGLWKEFHIGSGRASATTFREALVDAASRPFRGRPLDAERHRQSIWALKDVSFSVGEGEVLGIIGRNGAGKSTLLKVLSRITAPTRGRIEIHGRVASLLEVGTGFHPELTGRENIRLNGAILGMSQSEIRSKFDDIVAFSGVEKFLDTPVKRYSSGMQVRLAFAVAAHLDPEILIVDEVLAVGDAEFQRKCLGKMREVASAGHRTVLFVSHNLGAVKQMCEAAVYLHEGQVRAHGRCEDVANRYVTDTAAQRTSTGTLERLSNELELLALSVGSGGAAKSFDTVPFEITLRALAATTLVDLAILLEHDTGERAATIDCRTKDFPKALKEGDRATICGEVLSFNLVEGSYSLSVYQRTYASLSIVRDVARVVVTESMENQLHPPYRARDRGSVALKLRFAGEPEVIVS